MLTKEEILHKVKWEYSYFQFENQYAILRLIKGEILGQSFMRLFIPNIAWRYDADKMEGEFNENSVRHKMADDIFLRMQEKKMYAYYYGFHWYPPIKMFLFQVKNMVRGWWSSFYFWHWYFPRHLKQQKLLSQNKS